MSTDDTNAARRGSGSNDLLGPVRAAFERIALPNFHAPAQALIEDHWQTWQEAWEAAVAAERERCAKLCDDKFDELNAKNRGYHSGYENGAIDAYDMAGRLIRGLGA